MLSGRALENEAAARFFRWLEPKGDGSAVRNHRGGLRWTRLNEVVTADALRELVWRTVPSGLYPDSVGWRIELRPEGDATRVSESYRIVHAVGKGV